MENNIFDTHAHYTADRFDEDRDILLSSLPEKGIYRIINAGTTLADSVAGKSLSEKYEYMYFSAGIHPEELEDFSHGQLGELEHLAAHQKCVAIGEIGLDYYWDKTHKEEQKELFISQLILAKDLDLPVIIHDRDAHGDMMEILSKYRPKGVLHCFSGSAESAKEIVKIGMYLGFTGVATFQNSKKCHEAIAAIPPDRLLLETDCPYMAPVPFRGKRCDSSMIPYTAAAVAQIKGIGVDELLTITSKNASTLFKKIESI